MSRRVLYLSCWAVLGFVIAGAQSGLAPSTIEKIEATVKAEQERQKIPGLSLAIAVDGELRYEKGFGLADVENSVVAKPTTRFRTASIAKPMTAIAAMQLAEQGKLDLDAPIQKYCPAFPEKPWPVTARHLLGHVSGVRHYTRSGEASGTEHFFTVVDSLRIFKDDALLHQPGTRYTYSTYGYVLLGCAVEGASGMPYDAYMQKHVWGPAGMQHTSLDHLFQILPDRAYGYARLSERTHEQLPAHLKAQVQVGQIVNASLHDTSMKVPGGGLRSTAADLVRFVLAVERGKLVKPQTREAMWRRQKTADGKETNYGLGWGIGELTGARMISHSGGQAGTAALLVLLPEKKIVVAVMTNLEGAATSRIVRPILELLLAPRPGQ